MPATFVPTNTLLPVQAGTATPYIDMTLTAVAQTVTAIVNQ
jgi:hypothetical protein